MYIYIGYTPRLRLLSDLCTKGTAARRCINHLATETEVYN